MHEPLAYHLIPADVWESSGADAALRPASLATDGYVHLTHRTTDLVEVANTFYRSDPRPHVVLTVRLASLSSAWRYDGDERFPHVYGPIDRAAITAARPMDRAADGTFLLTERPDEDGARDLALPSDHEQVDFDEAIEAALERLPRPFHDQLGSVAIVVEDEATAEQLAAVRAPGLFGLYQGVPRTLFGADNVPIPSKITLFRGPLMRAHPTPATLSAAIEDTLLHEIAHHLGIDDDRLREIRAGAGRHA